MSRGTYQAAPRKAGGGRSAALKAGRKARLRKKKPSPRPASSDPRALAGPGRELDSARAPETGLHERQADEAARRAVRGETEAAAELMPAPPAARPAVPGSPGRPLPTELRRELEEAFGADLAAVRLHDDPAAAAAARTRQALAFAAGAHVFFSAEAPDPLSPAGLPLLAHEIAHVLQQTGRRGADGRLRAADLSGSGPVQRAGGEGGMTSWTAGGAVYRAEPRTLRDIAARHEEHLPEAQRKGFQRLVTHIASSFPVPSPGEGTSEAKPPLDAPISTALTAPLAASVESFRTYSRTSQQLVYDVLKMGGHFDAAWVLLQADRRMKTHVWKEEMVAAAYQGMQGAEGFELWKDVTASHDELHRLRDAHLDLYRDLIFHPHRSLQAKRRLEAARTKEEKSLGLEMTLDAVHARMMDYGASGGTANEGPAAAARVLGDLEAVRKVLLDTLPEHLLRERWSTAHTGLYLAGWMRDTAHHLREGDSPLLAWLGEELLAIAEPAFQVWEAALTAGPLLPSGGAPAGKGAEGIPPLTDPFLARDFPEIVAEAMTKLTALTPKGEIPSAREYKRARDRAEARLRRFARRELRWKLYGAAQQKAPDTARMTAYAWALRSVEILVEDLEAYGATGEEKASGRATAGADERVAHRLRTARRVAAWARRLLTHAASGPEAAPGSGAETEQAAAPVSLDAWRALAQAMEKVVEHRDQGASRVAIVGDWKRDPTAAGRDPVRRLAEDFPGDIRGYDPLSAATVARLAQTLHAEALAAAVDALIAGGGKGLPDPLAEDAGSLLSELRQRLGPGLLPERYALEDFELDLTPADRTTEPGKPSKARVLLMEHPKTERFTARLLGDGSTYTVAWPLTFQEESTPIFQDRGIFPGTPFFWKLPVPAVVVGRLRASRRVRDLFEPAMAQAAGVPRAEVEGWPWLRWLEAMAELAVAGSRRVEDLARRAGEAETAGERRPLEGEAAKAEGDLAEASRSLNAAVRSERKAARKERDAALARLTLFERRRLAAAIRRELAGYDSRAAEDYGLPNRVLTAIELFTLRAFPQEQAALHQAALVLEAAPALAAALGPGKEKVLGLLEIERGPATRFDLITGYLPLLVAARALGRTKRLDPFLDAGERAMKKERLALLDTLIVALQAERRRQQARRGFTGRAAEGKVWVTGFASPIEASDDPADGFDVEGTRYGLVEVVRDFAFAPAYGDPSFHKEGAADSLLEVDGKPVPPEKRTGDVVLMRVERGGQILPVTPADDALLAELHRVFTTRAHVQGLEATAAVIEGAGQLAYEMAELVPGWGQALMVGRVSKSLLEFMGSLEFDALMRLLGGELRDRIERFGRMLAEQFTPDGLVEFLFFGSSLTERLAALSPPPELEASLGKDIRKGRLGKLVRRAKQAGYAAAGLFAGLEKRVRRPVENLQLFVQVHPTLAALLEKAAGLETLSPDLDASFTRAERGLREKVTELLGTLRSLQIPKEIVPLDGVLELLLDVLVPRLGLKVKAAWVVLRPALEATGVLDMLGEEVESQLKGSAVDPNLAWEEHVVSNVESLFQSAVNEAGGFLDGLYKRLREVGPFVRPDDVTIGSLGSAGGFAPAAFEGGEAPQVQPLLLPGETGEEEAGPGGPSESRERRRIASTLAAPAGGVPLPPRVRSDAEMRFGHDFGHVRVHAGGDAERVTEGLGARALATGSHVFLHSAADLSGRSEVLDHELAHVLQQTGPRPLAEEHSSLAVRGAPRAGGPLLDLSGEEAAERVAARVKGRTDLEPVEIDGRAAAGPGTVQPLSRDTVNRLLRRLTDLSEVEAVVERIEALSGKQRTLTRTRLDLGEGLWDSIREQLRSLPKQAFARHLGDGWVAVRDHLTDSLAANKMGPDMRRKLAAAAVLPVEGKPPRAGAHAPEGKAKPTYGFHPQLFARALEAYFLARGGVAMDVDLGWKGRGEKKEIEVKRVDVNGIALSRVGGTSHLWTNVMAPFTTYGYFTRRSVGAASAPGVKANPEQELHRLRGTARHLLEKVGYAARAEISLPDGRLDKVPVFATRNEKGDNTLRFHRDFAKYIYQQSMRKTELDDLPPWKNYTDTGEPHTKEKPGLRVGAHGDHKSPLRDRNSHHTTQYVLIEYFVGEAGRRPFHPGYLYPGLNGTKQAGRAQFFQGSTGDPIRFKSFDDGKRGKEMPAILIAEPTHQLGRLHVEPDASDEGGKKSQGGWVDARFHEALEKGFDSRGLYKVWEKAQSSKVEFNRRSTQHGKAFQDIFAEAILSTYREMRKKMMEALETALKTKEKEYYDRIVALKHTGAGGKILADWTSNPEDLGRVFREARRNNDKRMGDEGWK